MSSILTALHKAEHLLGEANENDEYPEVKFHLTDGTILDVYNIGDTPDCVFKQSPELLKPTDAVEVLAGIPSNLRHMVIAVNSIAAVNFGFKTFIHPSEAHHAALRIAAKLVKEDPSLGTSSEIEQKLLTCYFEFDDEESWVRSFKRMLAQEKA